MAIVGEPELSMFLSNHHSNVPPQLMDWTSGSRIMDQSNELSSSYTSSDPYGSQHMYFSSHPSQTPFDMSDSFHTPKLEPISNSSEFDYYGPPPQVNHHGPYHTSGGSSSFMPQRQVTHSYGNQSPVQQQQLLSGNGGTLEEIDGMLKIDSLLKNCNDVPLHHHQDLQHHQDLDPLYDDLVSLPQSSAPQYSFHSSHGSALGSVRLPGLDGGPVVSHQQTRNLWMDDPSMHSQAVLMRELQGQILVDTSSLDTSQSMSSDTSSMTFASPSESAMSSNFYPEVGRSHGMSPTGLGGRSSLKVASPSSSHQQQMVLDQQHHLVLKKEQHSSVRMSSPVIGGGYSHPEPNLMFRQGVGSGFGPSSSSLRQLHSTRLPSQYNHLVEQILPGTSGPATGLQLVHMLLACAEFVAENNLNDAEVILVRLREHVLPDGNPMQRLAAYFEQALTARLKMENSLSKFQGPEERSLSQAEELQAFSVFYDCIPIGKFGHLTCNQILLDAVARESSIHVLDLHIFHGMQWPAFLQALALRGGEIPKLRLTAVGSDDAELKETGEKLLECAKNLKVPFEYCPIQTALENFNADLVQIRRGEALVVNSFVQFHTILNKGPNRVNMLLADLRRLNPRVMAFAENDGNHNSNSFLTRFVECLRYYSAMFDAFDASLPPDSPARMKMEEIFAAQKIRNVIACEGPARENGHETMKYWHKKMESAHFRCVNLSSRAISQAHLLLNLYYSNGYTLNTSECGYLALGWHGMPLIGVSAWN